MSSVYTVQSIDYPWLGGEGFMAGRPVLRLRLGSVGRKMTAHQIAARVVAHCSLERNEATRWVAITGDTIQADNELCLQLRSGAGKLSYIEAYEARSMCDRNSYGTLPIWDHVCFRPTLPTNPNDIPIFHSVIVGGNPTPNQIIDFDHQLDKIAYRGERYLQSGIGNLPIVKKYARHWCLTQVVAA